MVCQPAAGPQIRLAGHDRRRSHGVPRDWQTFDRISATAAIGSLSGVRHQRDIMISEAAPPTIATATSPHADGLEHVDSMDCAAMSEPLP